MSTLNTLTKQQLIERIKADKWRKAHRPVRIHVLSILKIYGSADKWRVAKLLDVGQQQGRKYLQELHADGDLYICGWTRKSGTGHWAAVYGLKTVGDEVDEVKPKPIGKSEIMNRYHVKIKAKDLYNELSICLRAVK